MNKLEVSSENTWTKEQISQLILEDNEAVYSALILLWEYQTQDEKKEEVSTHTNGRGFNYVDSTFLSSLVNFYTKAGFLTPKQLQFARKALSKYMTQLCNILNGKFFIADVIKEL